MSMHLRPLLKLPLRRAAGERAGPIAKQWEGEVAPDTKAMFESRDREPTSPSPLTRVPSLSPRDDAGGEGVRAGHR